MNDFFLWYCINPQWLGKPNANLWLNFTGADYRLTAHFTAPDEYALKQTLTEGYFKDTASWFGLKKDEGVNGVRLLEMFTTPERDVTFGDVFTIGTARGRAFLLTRMGKGIMVM